jgi:hypothetical protein
VERRFAVHAGSHRQALIAAFLVSAATAQAAPKDKEAKKMFDKGVAAYTKGQYATASAALSESYAREGDPETLFAWAQSEKKLGHCANAIELYNTLLAFDLPVENKKVIEGQLAECKPDDKPADKDKLVKEKAEKEKADHEKAEKADREKADREKTREKADAEKKSHEEKVAQVSEEPIDKPEVHASTPESRPWWKDPVGDTLVVTGAIGLGVGTVMLVSAHSADKDKTSPGITYTKYKSDLTTAHDDGLYGVVGLVAGSALVFGGVAWYATHKDHSATVTGYLAPTGGGLAVLGSF